MDSGEKKNILVVDDDREIVRAIALNLESEGYNVFKAYDGMEALDLAMTKDIHCPSLCSPPKARTATR